MRPQPSLWDFADRLEPLVKPSYRLTLGEGHTPLIEIEGIFFKREDLNPSGSVKDRGLAYQISALYQQGHKNFVISSSGNAAISAAAYCQLANLKLTVFVSPKIPQNKLKKLQSYSIEIIPDSRPISSAARYAKANNAYNLRPSQDALGSIGYQTIAYELAKQLPKPGGILYAPVSSGATLTGIINGFKIIDENFPMHFWAVQTTAVHPLAGDYDNNYQSEPTSLATGLVAKTSALYKQIDKHLVGGWVVSNQQIEYAHKWLTRHNITTSYEGAAALAGLFKSLTFKRRIHTPTIILLTGSL